MGSNEVINFGCRLNAYEADVMKSNLEEASIKNTTIFNTCAVTKEAERQAKQAIRKYINTYGKNKKIIITGCSAQINPEFYQDIQPDLIIGNEEKLSPPIYQNLNSFIQQEEKILVNDIMASKGEGISANPKRMQPSLHFLHYSIWAWQ
jgi:threonylcarbamoyladenosine tRNA methylthiotransferase MtaB